MKNILVTGANGFVGRRVCALMQKEGYAVRRALRSHKDCHDGAEREGARVERDIVSVGNIDGGTDWSKALEGVDVVIHLAARVHVVQEKSKNPIESFRLVNVHGTERLARAAIENGVMRLIYISSISIHGNSTGDRAYVEEDEAQPRSSYAISKWEGELVLRKIKEESDLEIVIVRPPLVYGAGVGGNFLRLMQCVHRGLPLPLRSIQNKRSFIAIENLADLIVCCVSSPQAAGETFVVADGEDFSTPDLITRIAKFMGKPARLVPMPLGVIRTLGKLVGKDDVFDRLCNSMRVDASKAKLLLGWSPRISLDEGLSRTVKWYMEKYQRD